METVMKHICPPGIQISSYLRQQGHPVTTPCGGRGNCGKCRITVVEGELPVSAMDKIWLKEEELQNGVRLACQAMPEKEITIAVAALAGCAAPAAYEKEAAVEDSKISSSRFNEVEGMKTIYLAGGCFWGVQKYLDQFDGVIYTETGYANGPDQSPSYEEVCNNSGHAETVKVEYDENRMSLPRLLEYYFLVIDPLSVNRQGNDRGIQYRTGIYYTEDSQLPEIEAVYRTEEEKAGSPLAVELEPLRNFFTAEEYYQKYLDKNPGGYCHIPKTMFSLYSNNKGGRK